MEIIRKIKSIKNEKDIFGFGGPFDIDHVWPTSKGGSNIKQNKICLSTKANKLKASKTRGTINGVRFSVVIVKTRMVKGKQESYGVLFIKNKKNEWEQVLNG